MNLQFRFFAPAFLFGTAYCVTSFAAVNTPQEGRKMHDFSLAVQTSVSTTDNRDQTDDAGVTRQDGSTEKPERNTTWRVGPNFSYKHTRSDIFNFDLSYAPSFQWESDPEDKDDEENFIHNFNGRLHYQPTSRLVFNLRENYSFQSGSEYYYGTDYEHDEDRESLADDYYRNRLTGSLRYVIGEHSYADLSGYWNALRYDEKKFAEYKDEDEFGGTLAFMKSCSDRLEIGLFASAVDWSRESSEYFNNNGIDVGYSSCTFGVQAVLDFYGDGEHILFASTGYQNVSYDDDELEDQDLFGDSRVELRMFQSRPTQLTAGLRYGIDAGDVYPFSSQEDLASYVSVFHRMLNNDLTLSAAFEYRIRTYTPEDIDPDAARYGYIEALKKENNGSDDFKRNLIFARLSATYRFTEKLTGSAWYSFETVDTDVGSDYDENIFGVSASYTFF